MDLTREQFIAVYSLAGRMAKADGKVSEEERKMILQFLAINNALPDIKSESDLMEVENKAAYMTLEDACSIIKESSDAVKKFLSEYLKYIGVSDHNCDDREIALYMEIANLCDISSDDNDAAAEKDASKVDDEDEDDDFIDSEGDKVVDNISYQLWPDSTATADMFEDDEVRDEITVVSSIKYKGKEYIVTSFAIIDGEYGKLNLPGTIKSIDGAFSDMDRDVRDNLTVNLANNPNITFEKGVFYSKDYKTLLNANLMPDCKEYTVKDGVEMIINSAFEAHNEIETLNIPASVKQIDSPFSEDSELKTVNIFNREGSVKFYDEEPGVESFPEGTVINYNSLPKSNKEPRDNNEHLSKPNIQTKGSEVIKAIWSKMTILQKVIAITVILLPFFVGFWAIIITILVLWYLYKKNQQK